MEMMVCPMGSSRLFGTLAQQDYYSEHQDSDQDPEGLEQANPDQLLRDCVEALQNRPAWPHSLETALESTSLKMPLSRCIHLMYLGQVFLSWRRSNRNSHSPLTCLHHFCDHLLLVSHVLHQVGPVIVDQHLGSVALLHLGTGNLLHHHRRILLPILPYYRLHYLLHRTETH